MTSTHVGLICLLLFVTSQGIRDAYFGSIFQTVSFLLVAAMAFGLSSVFFTLWSLLRGRGHLRQIVSQSQALIMLNLTTTGAWLGFFYGLKFLEPAVVATLHNGVGPLVVLAFGSLFGRHQGLPVSRMEGIAYFGIAAALAGLIIVVLADQSGMSSTDWASQLSALAIVVFGGTMITISYFYTRQFTDMGVGSDAVMATRFVLTFAIALILEVLFGDPIERPAGADVPLLATAAFLLIVVPSFLVQFGVSRTTPLAANVFRALGPVFVFAIQQFDDRLNFSGMTLICIAAFSIFTIAASMIRGWRELQDSDGRIGVEASRGQ